MATRKSSSKPKLVDATGEAAPERSTAERQEHMADLALYASHEIEALANVLKSGEAHKDALMFAYVARGVSLRIKALNGIIMSALGESDFHEHDVQTYERELYG